MLKYSVLRLCTRFTKSTIFFTGKHPSTNQSNSSVERGIKSIEEGLRVELLSGAPIQEAVHAVAGRLNRTTSSPCEPVRTPYEVVFKFCEANPPFPLPSVPRDFVHDLNLGQHVLVKFPNVGKLSPQFEDKGLHVSKIVGDNVYQLSDCAYRGAQSSN